MDELEVLWDLGPDIRVACENVAAAYPGVTHPDSLICDVSLWILDREILFDLRETRRPVWWIEAIAEKIVHDLMVEKEYWSQNA